MKNTFLKIAGGWLIVTLLGIPAVLTPVVYTAMKLGNLYLSEAAPAARLQAIESMEIVGAQAEGDLTPARLVEISEVLSDLKSRSQGGFSSLGIVEVALVNTKGKVLAHTDVTMMAGGTPSRYTSDEFMSAVRRVRRDAVQSRPLENYFPSILPSFGLKGGTKIPLLSDMAEGIESSLMAALRKAYPDLFISKYHVSTAIYPLDGEAPIGAIHLIAENRTPARVFAAIGNLIVPLTIAVFGSMLIFLVLILPILIWMSIGSGGQASPIVHSSQASHAANADDHHELDPGDLPEAQAETFDDDIPSHHVDFDDIPLPDFIDEQGHVHHAQTHTSGHAQTHTSGHTQTHTSVHAEVASAHSTSHAPVAAVAANREILDAIPLAPGAH